MPYSLGNTFCGCMLFSRGGDKFCCLSCAAFVANSG